MISFTRIRQKLKARLQAKPKAKAKAKAKAAPKARAHCLRCLWEAYDWRYIRICEAFGLRCPSPPRRGCRTTTPGDVRDEARTPQGQDLADAVDPRAVGNLLSNSGQGYQ